MGANYGESGSNQGLTRSETSARNNAMNAINASKNPYATYQKQAKLFKTETGKNLSDYIEEPKKPKKKK